MTQDPHQPNDQDAARHRIHEIEMLFESMSALLTKWLREAGPPEQAGTKQMMTKISELQTTHMMVLRAQEVFHDKFATETDADCIDYAVARDDIGRTLDRLRAAITSKPVSGGADSAAD